MIRLQYLYLIFFLAIYSISNTNAKTLTSTAPETLEELLQQRLKWKDYVKSRFETLGYRHQKKHWNIFPGQTPNPKYKDGFEYTREYYIDNKDRHDLELSYLLKAQKSNFYLNEEFLNFIDHIESLNELDFKNLHNEINRAQQKECNKASLSLVFHSLIDATPILAGIQAEIYDKLVDKNTHSPESGLAGIAGGVLGSLIEWIIHRFYQMGHRKKNEFDGGLWAITRIIWNENFGVNSKCFIENRKLEAILVFKNE